MANIKEVFSRAKATPVEKLTIATTVGATVGLGKFLAEGGLFGFLINVVPFAIAFLGAGLLTMGSLATIRAIRGKSSKNK